MQGIMFIIIYLETAPILPSKTTCFGIAPEFEVTGAIPY